MSFFYTFKPILVQKEQEILSKPDNNISGAVISQACLSFCLPFCQSIFPASTDTQLTELGV